MPTVVCRVPPSATFDTVCKLKTVGNGNGITNKTLIVKNHAEKSFNLFGEIVTLNFIKVHFLWNWKCSVTCIQEHT